MAAGDSEHRCEYRERVEQLEAELTQVNIELAALKRQVFGRKSEKLPRVESQLRPKRSANDPQAQAVRAERRAKQMELAGCVQVHEVPEERRTCPNCEHQKLKSIGGGRRSATLDYVPGFLVREEHVQQVLACTTCDYVVRADAPKKVFERTRYGPGLMAHIVTQKCADSMPIYRLEKQLKRLDVPIGRSTLTDLFHRAAEELAPVSKRLQEKVSQAEIVQADETPVKVQKRKKRGYMWTFVAEDAEIPGDLVSFRFSPDRSGQTPLEVLKGTQGTLVVDAYTGYNAVTDVDGRERAGCMAHVRRKFFEAMSSAPKAEEAMEIILDAYRVEHDARELGIVGTPQHLELRQTRSRDAMERLREWLTEHRDQYPPKSSLARAIAYADNNWDALERFLEDVRIPIDNNASERALRRVALGRKNFLFVGHDQAGANLAGLYSLVATCEANDVNPEAYIADVLMRLDEQSASEIDELLPHQWKPSDRKIPEWLDKAIS